MALVGLLAASPAAAGVAAVWAVSDGEKVEQGRSRAPAEAAKRRLGRADACASPRLATRSWRSRRSSRPMTPGSPRFPRRFPTLRRDGGGDAISYTPPAADPSLSLGRAIQLFSVHYMDVQGGEPRRLGLEAGSRAAPRDTLGWKPVQLVPENARSGRGGFPLAVGPGLGQSLWIEVYVGRDKPRACTTARSTLTRGRDDDGAARRAARLRLRAAGREQPARDGLLRAGAAAALPGPEPRSRLPPLRPPPPRRARARVRRGDGRGPARPLRREATSRRPPATRGPARARATRSCRCRSTDRGGRSRTGRAPGSARTRG